MKLFLFSIFILLLLDVVIKFIVLRLTSGKISRSRVAHKGDMVLNLGFCVWALVLIWNNFT